MSNSTAYANAPFDHKKADIILRSSDNVDFRVFRLFLSLASPFFQTLFEIPQPSNPSKDQEIKDGLVVIPVSESSKTLDALLRFCYPCTLVDDPKLDVLRDALDVLNAAKKYSLDVIEKKARQAIVNRKFLEVEPLRCFAIARRGRLHEEALLAAKYTLTQPLIPRWFQEINIISAADLLALLTYHKACGDAVYDLRNQSSWITSYYGSAEACSWFLGQYETGSPFRIDTRNSACRCQKSEYRVFDSKRAVQWWQNFMDEVFVILRDKPCRATVQTAAEKMIQTVKALKCEVCSPAVTQGMLDFSELLARKVEEVVSTFKLQLPAL